MKRNNIIINILILFLFLIPENFFGQNVYNIDYYGIVSSEVDENLYKMTSDLYYTQLSEINSFSITDKRSENHLSIAPEKEILSNTNLSFYAVIEKKENSTTWVATLNLIDKKNSLKRTDTKEYDSYYKILMEPKTMLQESLKKLITNTSFQTSVSEPVKNNKSLSISSIENLSGTWIGEKGISKIVIMRGGRGFVIFENGASMNINLSLNSKGTEVTITQNGKSNASFYPEIPRNLALNAAINATPIKWILSLSDTKTLSGIKETLVLKDDKVNPGSVNVSWTKKD